MKVIDNNKKKTKQKKVKLNFIYEFITCEK